MVALDIIREETTWNPTHKVKYIDQKIERETIEECFKALYGMNRTYRYVNDVCYYPKTLEMQKKYADWYRGLDHQTSFDMYYGGGIVD